MSTARAFSPLPDPVPPPRRSPAIELETVACLLCGGQEFETVLFASDPTTGIGGRFRVVRCRDCSLVYTNPRPTPETIGVFYPDDYQPYQGRAWDDTWRGRLRRRLELAVLRTRYGYPPDPFSREPTASEPTAHDSQLTPNRSPATQQATDHSPLTTHHSRFPDRLLAALALLRIRRSRQRQSWIPFRAPGRLLDFGCGAGSFLQEMRAFGWTVEGLDVSADVARQVEAETGIKVHVGTLPHPRVAAESFDAVTMWNSLEHVHQPRETVRAAGAALRKGGLLVVGVPNFASWGYRTFQHDWHGLELPRHLTHFTPQTLAALLEREGYRVLSLDQIARAGWTRRSARRAVHGGGGPWWWKLLSWKPIGVRVADWTERAGQADFIRAVAEKR